MMSLFCNHEWESRTGYAPGSVCVRCWALSDRETIHASGLSDAKLAPAPPGFFCRLFSNNS